MLALNYIKVFKTMLIFLVSIYVFILFFVAKSGRRPVGFKNDAFFCFFLIQVFIFLVLAPALVMGLVYGYYSNDYNNYLNDQFWSVCLFLIPLIVLYRFFLRLKIKRNAQSNSFESYDSKVQIHPGSITRFYLFWNLFGLLYLYEIISNNIVFRRIGTDNIAEIFSGLSGSTLFIVRSYELVAIPVIAFLLFMCYSKHVSVPKRQKWKLRQTLWFSMLIIGCMYLINSREQILDLIIFCLCAGVTLGILNLHRKGVIAIAGTILLGVYLTLIVANIRITLLNQSNFYSQVLNPFHSFQQQSNDEIVSNWVSRLDCINLINLMQPQLNVQGFAFGEAWATPIMVTFGQLFDPSYVREAKASASTTAKNYLIQNYTNLGVHDYYSCSMTDVYGNFGFIGFPFAAFFFAAMYAFLARILNNKYSLKAILAGLILASYMLVFEQDFISFLIGWVRYIPVTILLLVFMPKIEKAGDGQSISGIAKG